MFNCSQKVNCVLGMINQNIKCKNAAIIMRHYKFLVRPRLEYCIQAWSPYHKKDIEILERVQKRATEMDFVCENLNYKDRLPLRIAIIRRTKGKGGFDRDIQVVKRYS